MTGRERFRLEVQRLILSRLISDPDSFARCRTILREEYFDDQLRPTARFILQYADDYRDLPKVDLIHAKTGQQLTLTPATEMVRLREWLLKEVEEFCKYRSFENALFASMPKLEKGDYTELYRPFLDSMTISLVSDLGTDFFAEPAERLRRMLDKSSFVSTGWQTLDEKLYGGFFRGGLNIFCGQSGSGKSLVLQNLAINWALDGHLVIYFTLELAEELVASRITSMITGRSTKEVFRDVDEAGLMINVVAKKSKAGRLQIKKMPEGSTTANHLRGYLKEFEIQTGRKPDAIVVDYLDLMYPTDRRINPSELFIKDKQVAEELRAMYHETNTFGATASQLNRQSFEADNQFQQSHIAGGMSKINTADNVFAIWKDKIDQGVYELQFMKTRTAWTNSQVRIKLHYNRDSMRIADFDEPSSSGADIRAEMTERSASSSNAQRFLSMIGR